ncbi:MAG: hypothetical protein ACREGL_08870 [Alphaproteobacteria bacterium]
MLHSITLSRSFLAAALLVPLGGCFGMSATVLLAGADLASQVNTGKGLHDHVASAAMSEDCSTGRYLEDHGQYCVDPDAAAELAAARPALYCYPSLGAVTCYDSPDPYANGARLIE